MGDKLLFFGKGSLTESGKCSILKEVLESGETANEKVVAPVIAMNDAGLHQLFQYLMLRNQAIVEAVSPVIHSYAHSSSQESARSLFNLNTIFPLTTATNVAVAVINGLTIDIESTPHRIPTSNEEEYSTKLLERCCKLNAQMLKSKPVDPLENGAFEFKKNGTFWKNASGKAGEMKK